MLARPNRQPVFSDDAIGQFLLGRLHRKDQAAFERALFLDSELEQRTRLEEIALADDYATHNLSGTDLAAFVENFPVSTARRNQIEVSAALSESFAPGAEVQRANTWLTLKHPVWKLAFATMILIVLFATIWLATKEPRIVQRLIPHRSRPAAATTPMPQVTHHAEQPPEQRSHREDSPAPPSHEAATSAIVLDSSTTLENSAVVTLATVHDDQIRVQLMLDAPAQSTYVVELMKSSGAVVYSEQGLAANGGANFVSFNIPVEQLATDDFQIRVTRTSDSRQAIYFLRVR